MLPILSLVNGRPVSVHRSTDSLEGDAAREPRPPIRRMHLDLRRPRRVAGLRVLAVAVSLVVVGGCSRRSASGGDVGIAVALNPQRAGMQSIYNGVELAVAHLNAQYGDKLGGAKYQMVKGAP